MLLRVHALVNCRFITKTVCVELRIGQWGCAGLVSCLISFADTQCLVGCKTVYSIVDVTGLVMVLAFPSLIM